MPTKTDYKSTREYVLNAPIPKESRTYKPVTNKELIDVTTNGIIKAGFEIDREFYSSANNGMMATGKYTIKNVKDDDMQLQIAWQNSYDKTVSLKFAIGTRVMVCSNGCVSGDMGAFKKKHIGQVQTFTPNAITEYLKSAEEAFARIQAEKEMMKNVEVTKRTKAELIGRLMIEEALITSTQMNMIARELEAPTHDYGAKDSMWELYNYTTFALKEVHPSNWMGSHLKAHEFFVNNSNIVLPAPKEIEIIPESLFTQLEIF